MEKVLTPAIVGITTGNVGKLVETFVALALSMKHSKGKCKALSERVEIAGNAIIRIEQDEHGKRRLFEDPTVLANCIKNFQDVVKDGIDLLRRYENKTIFYRLFFAPKYEEDFDSLDQRLVAATRFLALDLQIHNTIAVSDFRHEYAAAFAEIKELLERIQRDRTEATSEEVSHSLNHSITVVEEVVGEYLLTGRLGTCEVILIASGSIGNKEVEIAKLLCGGHCNILRFLGMYYMDECKQYYMVMERPGEKEIITLDMFIANNLQVDWRTKKMIALEIALGIEYAHGADVIHRMLRSPNIFLSDDLHPKIHGLIHGRVSTKPSEKRFNPKEQYRWAAPEMLVAGRSQYTKECDIFSLGVIIWELINWAYPFEDIKSVQQVIGLRTKKNKTLEFNGVPTPTESAMEFIQISLDCMQANASSRPDIHQVVDRLSKLAPETM